MTTVTIESQTLEEMLSVIAEAREIQNESHSVAHYMVMVRRYIELGSMNLALEALAYAMAHEMALSQQTARLLRQASKLLTSARK